MDGGSRGRVESAGCAHGRSKRGASRLVAGARRGDHNRRACWTGTAAGGEADPLCRRISAFTPYRFKIVPMCRAPVRRLWVANQPLGLFGRARDTVGWRREFAALSSIAKCVRPRSAVGAPRRDRDHRRLGPAHFPTAFRAWALRVSSTREDGALRAEDPREGFNQDGTPIFKLRSPASAGFPHRTGSTG